MENTKNELPQAIVSPKPLQAIRQDQLEHAREALKDGEEPYAVWSKSMLVSPEDISMILKEEKIPADELWFSKGRKQGEEQHAKEDTALAELKGAGQVKRAGTRETMPRSDWCWRYDFDEALSGHRFFNAAEEMHAYQMKNYLTEDTQEIGDLFPDAWIFADSPATADELKEFVRLVRDDESVQEDLAELRGDL